MHLRPMIVVLAVLAATPVSAQELGPAERQAAAEAAYDRGTRAYRGGDYAQAARWYETANELAPAAAAALQALRAHQRANNTLRAGMIAAHVLAEYGEGRLGRHASAIEAAAAAGVRVDITCEECRLEVDGEREVLRTFFLSPDVTHAIVAIFEEGRVEEEVRGAAGEQRELTLTPPEPEPVEPDDDDDDTGGAGGAGGAGPTGPVTTPRDEGGGLSPAFFVTGLVLTAAVGGLAIWSWIDTLDAANEYEMMPTRERLDAGRDLELRTTLLDIGAGVLGAATLVFLFLTDWGGGDDGEEERPSEGVEVTSFGASPVADGAVMGLGGTF